VASPESITAGAAPARAVSVEALQEALRSAQTGYGSHGPNYDGNKLAASVQALIKNAAS